MAVEPVGEKPVPVGDGGQNPGKHGPPAKITRHESGTRKKKLTKKRPLPARITQQPEKNRN